MPWLDSSLPAKNVVDVAPGLMGVETDGTRFVDDGKPGVAFYNLTRLRCGYAAAERFDTATSTTGAISLKSTPMQAGGCFTNAYCAEYADNADTLVMRHGVFRRSPESGYYFLKYPEVVLRNGDHGFVEGIMEVRRV